MRKRYRYLIHYVHVEDIKNQGRLIVKTIRPLKGEKAITSIEELIEHQTGKGIFIVGLQKL